MGGRSIPWSIFIESIAVFMPAATPLRTLDPHFFLTWRDQVCTKDHEHCSRGGELLYNPKDKEGFMNKAELVSTMSKAAGITKGEAERALNSMQDCVVDAVRKGEKVTLVGFGTFSTVQRKARTGRNPQTGAEIRIPAKRVPKFSPGIQLRDAATGRRARKK